MEEPIKIERTEHEEIQYEESTMTVTVWNLEHFFLRTTKTTTRIPFSSQF